MSDFEGKVVVITGANSGIGNATAVALAKQGAKVVCAARRTDLGEATLETVRAAGGDGDFIRTDIADPTSVASLFQFVEKKYGRLDGAFNNAGLEIDLAPLPEIPLASFDQVMNVNVRGTFICLQHEMRIMRAQKRGAIVNTSSLGGVLGLRGASAYVASKHAIVGMTKAAAIDVGEFGVRVNVICPGCIATPMSDRWTQGKPEVIQHLANYAALKRIGNPIEAAEVALWLLSDRSTYVTGLVMEVDGGVSSGLAS